MIEFEVSKPFNIPTFKDKKGIRHLDRARLNDFWMECDPDAPGTQNGCYIFGMSTKNIKPWYVGKTWKGFRNETFKSFQETKINRFINDHGRPVVIFVYKNPKEIEGEQTRKIIKALENFLIQSAVSVNPDLLNIHGTEAKWAIKGIIRSPTVGNKSKALKKFSSMLDL